MDPNLAVGIGSLVFTIIGAVAAILTIRRSDGPRPVHISGTVDSKPALRLLRRGAHRTHTNAPCRYSPGSCS